MPRRAFFAALLATIAAATGMASAQLLRDANCDGVIDERDRSALVEALYSPTAPSCPTADINRDGRVSVADLVAFALGPRISFIGLASLDGRPAPIVGTMDDGTPVYYHSAGFGFLLVIEGVPSADSASVGTTLFNTAPNNPSRRPDLEILVDHPLGDGDRAVCNGDFGVPAVDPPSFALVQSISDALNDLACRFSAATSVRAACTQDSFGQPAFVAPTSRTQFCLAVNSQMAFPAGSTHVTVQLRDVNGLIGPTRRLILQIGGPPPATFTAPAPTATRTATGTASATPPPSATAVNTVRATSLPTLTRTATQTRTAIATVTQPVPPSPSGTATATLASTVTPAASQTASSIPASLTPTAPPSFTATASPVAIASSTPIGSSTSTATRTARPTRAAGLCPGDCNGSRDVTISELITLVNIALGTADVSTCLAGDTNDDDQITIAEIIQAVGSALNGCGLPTPTVTATATRGAVSTPTAAATTPSASGFTPSPPNTPTGGASPPTAGTPPPNDTPTPTATGAAIGPTITFLGLTRFDDFLLDPSCPSPMCEPPVYEPSFGFNFKIIVEAAPGTSRQNPGTSTFNPTGGAPDLQVEVSQPIGNGSPDVCDNGTGTPPKFGGVPATDPPDFSDDPSVADRLNDLACRFTDGTDQMVARTCSQFSACILGTDGQYSCQNPASKVQFCGPMVQILAFPPGDTLVTARVRDVAGNLGPESQLIVHVQ